MSLTLNPKHIEYYIFRIWKQEKKSWSYHITWSPLFAVTNKGLSIRWINWHCSRRDISQKPQFKAWYPMLKDRMTAVFSSLFVRIISMAETNQIKTSLSLYINQADLKTNVHSSSEFRKTLTGLWVKTTARGVFSILGSATPIMEPVPLTLLKKGLHAPLSIPIWSSPAVLAEYDSMSVKNNMVSIKTLDDNCPGSFYFNRLTG